MRLSGEVGEVDVITRKGNHMISYGHNHMVINIWLMDGTPKLVVPPNWSVDKVKS